MTTKKQKTNGTAQAELAELHNLALRYHLQTELLAHELARRGATPEDEPCRNAPEQDGIRELHNRWLETASAVADGFLADYAKEHAQRA